MTLIGKTKELDMVHGPILKNIILFSLPLMASMLLQMLFNAADTIVVGHFAGDKALAAVGNTGSVIFLLTALFFGLATGANVVIANAIGANDEQRVQKSVHIPLGLLPLHGVLRRQRIHQGIQGLLRRQGVPEEFPRGVYRDHARETHSRGAYGDDDRQSRGLPQQEFFTSMH